MLSAENLTTDGSPFHPTHIVAGGPGFVAAGALEEHGGTTAAVWHSTDGVTWRQGSLPEVPTGEEGYSSIAGLVVAQERVIAVGRRSDLSEDGMAAWSSADGISWTREAPVPGPPPGSPLAVGDAVSDGSKVVVLGAGGDFLWVRTAPDARWSTVPFRVAAECAIDTLRNTAVGVLLLGRCSEPGDDDPAQAALYALEDDGVVRDLGSAPGIAWAISAASIGGTTLLLGYERDGLGRYRPAYSIADGGEADWLQARTLPLPENVLQADVSNVAQAGSAFIVTGLAAGPSAVPQPIIWISEDHGSTWDHHLMPAYAEDAWVESVAEKDGRVVILANRGYLPEYAEGVIVNFTP